MLTLLQLMGFSTVRHSTSYSQRNVHRISIQHGIVTRNVSILSAKDMEIEASPLNSGVDMHHLYTKAPATIQQTECTPDSGSDTEYSVYGSPEKEAQSKNSGDRWFALHLGAPSWTHPATILGFCIAFGAIIVLLLTTLHLSETRDGFATSKFSSPFVWRYVPTAVFTIIIALWRQVDYATKASAPWLELTKGYRTVHQTYLLDYNSPILPFSLYLSMKNKHWRVLSTITIFGLLKIIVVFSTGLLAFQNTKLFVRDYPVVLKPSSGLTDYGSYSSFYVEEVYGSLAKGLPYQPGTSKTAAFQELSTGNLFPPQAVITAEVSGFFPGLVCEDATMNVYWQNVTDDRIIPNVTTGVRVSTNTLSDFESRSCNGTIVLNTVSLACDYSTWTCASQNIYTAGVHDVYCPATNDSSNTDGPSNAFIIAALAFAADPIPGIRTTQSPFVSWSTAALCRPRYAIESAQLTIDNSATELSESKILSLPITSTGQQLANYSVSDLVRDLAVINIAGSRVTSALPAKSEQADYDAVDAWFQLMLYDLSSIQFDVFQNATALKESAANVFQCLAVQWVGSWISFPANLNTSATYTYEEQRLRVQRQATYQMCAGLSITAIFGFILLFGNLKAANFKLPTSISAVAVLLRSNLGIERFLSDIGNLSDKQLSSHLQQLRFSVEGVSVVDPAHKTLEDIADLSLSETGRSSSQFSKDQFWVPLSATKWFAALCICMPVCELIVLEVLQRRSDRHAGFCDVTTSPEVSHQIMTIVSALVMVSTAAMFSATEWAVGIFAPYHLLKKRVCRLKQVDNNHHSSLAPVALVEAVKHRQVAVLAMLLATVIGSMLTIAVSGLFTIVASSKIYDINAYSISQFNTNWSNVDKSDLTTTNVFTLIYNHNASEPDGTYQEVAFPNIQLNKTDKNVARILASQNVTNAFVDIHLPVLRASLNCSIVPQENISYRVKAARFSATLAVSPSANVNATFDLPEQCQFSSGQYLNSSQLLATYSESIPVAVNSSWVDGQLMDVTGLGAADMSEQLYAWPQYCPSLAFIVGRFANDTSVVNKTVIVCTQLQEEIPAKVRFNVPSLSRDVRTPVELDESQAKVVTGYQYQFPSPIQSESFYTTLANITGIQPEELVGDANVQKMIIATQHLYRLYMAQAFNAEMRLKQPSSNDAAIALGTFPIDANLYGTISDPTRIRIVQNNRSKIILQCFLTAMLFCYVTAYLTIEMTETLPHNPCTIAGAMSLLAGSQFAEEAHHIAQQNGDMNEPGRRLADSRLRMGWFKGRDDDSPRFGIDFDD